ncbi:MAG: type III-A CRISPR-associated RAMP protein Csm5 [Erysipelotrichaceae bacterium]|nr:type III-A CRISPR-associated RAMP protein Csm5 [Erysipelotrichaceae bacterium]
MSTVTILTPVHIGSGLSVELPSFEASHVSDHLLNRYDFSEVLASMPSKTLLDKQFLKSLASQQGSKAKLYSRIHQEAKYTLLKPLYSIVWKQETDSVTKGNIKCSRSDIAEQVKDLNKPYIPGSSLKGTIENALKFCILQEALEHDFKAIDNLLNYLKNHPKRVQDGFLLEALDNWNGKEANEFFNALFSCLAVSDVFFEKMEIFVVTRENIRVDKNMDLPSAETIQHNQSTEINQLIQIDKKKLEWLRKEYTHQLDHSWLGQKILEWFTLDNLMKACSQFTNYAMRMDKNKPIEEMYKEIDKSLNAKNGIIDFMESIIQQTESRNLKRNECILRVGKDTDYFFKSLSALIKNDYPDDYIDLFESVFSPLKVSKNKKKAGPDPDKMPVTRVVYYNDDCAMLPGFIRICL